MEAMVTSNDLTLQNLLNWKSHLRSQGYQDNTVSRKLYAVLTVWDVLHRNGLIPHPPPEAEEVGIPQKRRSIKRSLSEEEFLLFALTPPDSPYAPLHLRDEAMFWLRAAIPMSIRRMCELDRDNVDLIAGTLRLDDQVLTLPSAPREKLERYVQATPDVPPDGPVFVTYSDNRISHNAHRDAFHRHLESCGIQPVDRADLSRLSEEDRQRFLGTPVASYVVLENQPAYKQLVIDLLCWLGLRPSEVVELEARDVQIADRQLILRETKSGETQVLPIPEELISGLASWVKELAPNTRLFRTSDSDKTDRKRISRIARTQGRDCGLERVTPRLLRRSLSRILRDNGATIEQVGLLLRHSEFRKSTTAIYYAPTQPHHIVPVFDFHPLRLRARRSQ
jgi:site-specific recombinase XerD